MSGYELRELGRTGLKVTALGFGGVPVGDPAAATPEAQAQATLQAAWDAGIRFFDTAPWYGNTKSEHRIGHFLRQQPRTGYVLSTKVGRLYRRAADPERFLHERWAAGRPVPFEIWRCVGPFAEGAALEDLARVLASGEMREQRAAALALAASPDRRAARMLRDVPALAGEISGKRLTWATLQ